MTTFVLVHGAWHGGWCWKKVAPLLRQTGAQVHVPTLTGLGERSHLAGLMDPSLLNLDLHVQDIVRLLEYEDLRRVTLVGHAYAGMVITGVAESCPERLGHLVYVNGVVPRDRESMVDQLESVRGPQFVAWVNGHIERQEGFFPPPDTLEDVGRRWGITDPSDQEWVLSMVTPHPVASFIQLLRVGRPESRSIPRSFIGSSGSGFDSVADMAHSAGWGTFHIDTGHDPMITTSEELAVILLQIADKN